MASGAWTEARHQAEPERSADGNRGTEQQHHRWVDARALSLRLVSLIEHDHGSVAQAARSAGVALEMASVLVRMHAIELEAAESNSNNPLEDLGAPVPRRGLVVLYSDRQQTAIIQGSAIPARIMRELVETWQRRVKRGTGGAGHGGSGSRRGAAPLTGEWSPCPNR